MRANFKFYALGFYFLAAAWLAAGMNVAHAAAPVILPAAPMLPTIASTVYNVTVSNPAIDGGAVATTGSSNNAAVINAYISYVSSHGGGIVQLPTPASGTSIYKSGMLTMASNVNLQIGTNAILQASTAGATLITTPSSNTSNMAITGGGIIDGHATATSSNNLVSLQKVTNLLISGVTIENAGHEHLVPEKDTNVTISNVNINDDFSIANSTAKTYLDNTDAIDYSGSNFLIKGCTIAAGDDDIVAKPASTACNNIVISNNTIISGHGISIGGGTAAGVSNMIVANCTFNPALGNNPSKNSIPYGLRMKAEDGNDPNQTQSGDVGGGLAHPLQNVKYINITMTNVKTPIAIESFYDGGDTFAPNPTDSGSYTYGSATPTDISTDTQSPLWYNISYENVTATGATNVARINGLNATTDPVNKLYANALDGLAFSNVHLTGSADMQLYYGADVDLSGLTVTAPPSDLFGLTNSTTGAPPLLAGDFNRDGHVNSSDINAMLVALTNLPAYEASHGNLTTVQMDVIGDLNNDFVVNNLDLQALLNLFQAGGFGSTTSVPEPASLTLLMLGLGTMVVLRTAVVLRLRRREQ
ncbi:MAG TPA: glycosyl hydrolase family 28 protein [Pirellulales bacterium]|nr:glycosyl hydrolase family 28 protein [Pirellulales bacterium]